MSDLVVTQIVGFLMHRLNYKVSKGSVSMDLSDFWIGTNLGSSLKIISMINDYGI